MSIFKCKMCGGETTLDTINGIAICEYCGTKQALPLFADDSERLLYESGNSYLSHSEYDKAENVFNQLLTIKPNAAELYWDLVLCKYGVTYVKDPKTDNYIPTCNRTHYTPIFSDANYLKAIQLSSGEKKALFENDAKTIDEIQKGIIAVSKKEKPFDIFISYKETDANGNRTKDSVEAQKLYEKLTEAGYKVFFSRITLEDKVGTEYEPYIYAALYSSKVMLTICSSKENIETVWVKNEWGRFLSLQQKDADKTLIPLYFDMAKSDLPDEFSMIPSFNIKDDGFEAELIRGIKKQIPLPIMLAQKRKARRKAITVSLLSFLSVAVVCGIIFLPAVIKNHIHGNKYDEAMRLFKNQNYTEAKVIFETITDYENSEYMVERCNRQPEYDKALQLYYDGEYAQSAWAFKAMGDYEDAAVMQKKAESSWRNSLSSVYASDSYLGNYYITENGTINVEKGSEGNAHDGIEMSKNGKVVSVVSNNYYTNYFKYLFALHENGKISNKEIANAISNNPEWYDIIKVSDAMQGIGFVALRADGKMVGFSNDNEISSFWDNLANWTNIVDFWHTNIGGQDYEWGVLVGLKSDGTLCVNPIANDKFENIPFDVDEKLLIEPYLKYNNLKDFELGGKFGPTALTKDNKLLIYVENNAGNDNNPTQITLDGSNICDLVTGDIALKNNGDLIEIDSEKVLARDIVHAGKTTTGCYAVTRNGNIIVMEVSYDGIQNIKQTGIKIPVREEWVSRLD